MGVKVAMLGLVRVPTKIYLKPVCLCVCVCVCTLKSHGLIYTVYIRYKINRFSLLSICSVYENVIRVFLKFKQNFFQAS